MRLKLRYLLLVLGLMLSSVMLAQSIKWRDIYTVKKKDTIFSIAKKYGLSLPELMEANPEMKQEGYVLKKGDTLFIPYETHTQGTQTVAAGKNVTAAQQVTAAQAASAVKIGVMLPLHDVDGDGRRMVEYYRGILMACETLKQKGISTDIHAWNVPIDADIRTTLLQEGANKCDVIFGPLYSKQVSALAGFCKTYGIKMVIPFSITGDDVERNKEIFQVYQSPEQLNEATIQAFLKRFPSAHPIFVDCNDSTSRKGNFTFGLRKELERRKIDYSITNVNSSVDQFAKAFAPSVRNVVVLNTGRSPQLTAVLNKLDELDAKYPGAVVSLFGYTEWLMYAKYNLDRFYKYDTYIPSTFYYNANSARTLQLERNYSQWFHVPMMIAQPSFALTGYDHAMYFIQGIKKQGRNFVGTGSIVGEQPVQTPLRFVKTAKGGYRNQLLQLIHYTFNRQIEAVTY